MTRASSRALTLVAIWALLLAQPSVPVHAQSSPTVAEPPVMVVVDTSGSMSEIGADGKIKIESAGEALASMMRTAPGSTRVGIWTYPAQGGCDGGVLSTPVQPIAGLNAESVADSWTAEGDTPTALALRAAAEEIRRQQGRSIILISDGESRCSADPCSVAQDLVTEGFEIQVHTVGFAISNAGRDELICIADATGGTYSDALDAQQLGEIMADLSKVDVSVSAESRVEAQLAGQMSLIVDATVAVDGVVSAHDVEVTLRFKGDDRVALLDATRRFPVVAPNAPTAVTWRFEVPLDCRAYDVEYEVLVRRGYILEARTSGEIAVPAGDQDTVACLLMAGNVAILGDSYSSGEGAPEYEEGTNVSYNRCRRGQTYGRADRPIEELDDPSTNDLTILACSGAIIHDLLLPDGKNQKTKGGSFVRSQLEQLEAIKDDVDVVVLTISGNDLGFATIASVCLLVRCTDQSDAILESASDAAKTLLRRPLLRALRVIESTVNGNRDDPVQFVVLPYLGLLGEPGSSADCEVPAFDSGLEKAFAGSYLSSTVRIDAEEADGIREFQSRIHATLESVVTTLRLEDGRPFYFAGSVASAASQHSLCDDEPWGNAVLLHDLPGTVKPGRPGESFHPNREGYIGIWSALLADARAWPLLVRDVEYESSVDGGELCPDTGDYKILPLQEFFSKRRAELQRGECVVVVGKNDNWRVRSSVVVFTIQSDPELLGVAYPNDNGEFRQLLWIPDDIPIGAHTLSAIAVDSSGELQAVHVPVRIVEERTSPYKVAILVALAVLLLGFGLIALDPKRPIS